MSGGEGAKMIYTPGARNPRTATGDSRYEKVNGRTICRLHTSWKYILPDPVIPILFYLFA